tara:strand:+ start:6371 stop:7531 length:1161 start_codon:yes stop_codon:yes gene_type:complete
MLTRNIYFKNFSFAKLNKKIFTNLKKILSENNQILNSLKISYVDSFDSKKLAKFRNFKNISIIGMGGSILGSKAIYSFLKDKVKKKITFIDNLVDEKKILESKKTELNLIISKSGNTLETISNSNVLITKKQKNLFITENRESFLMKLANQLKADVIHHNNFIGGRYSVLSEVGMVPAQLMGLNAKNFRKFNILIKNQKFLNQLVINVSNIFSLTKKKKFNSIILNYDEKFSDFCFWYQQLVAESLGKKGKGILPIISTMPKDNHSLIQLYLDGLKTNFYTFFFVNDKYSENINNKKLIKSHYYLRNKKIYDIRLAQFRGTEKVFKQKKIPFRSFSIEKRNENALGELFSFFILETILLGKLMDVNPYNQPAVELIKTETIKNLKK